MNRLAVVTVLLSALAGNAFAWAQISSLRPGEVRAELAAAASARASLYREVGAQEPRNGDFVNVTSLGGLPPPDRLTVYLKPAGDLFRAELVIQDRNFGGPPTKTRRVTFLVDRKTSRKIAAILDDPALWKEPAGLDASCTDQPAITLAIAWKGRRREAVRLALGCTPNDLTKQLIDTAFAQMEKR